MGKLYTKKEEAWMELFLQTGKTTLSARIAGYKNPRQQGYNLKIRLAEEVSKRIQQNFSNIAPKAFITLKNLLHPRNPAPVRLSAAKDILDRAGFKPTERDELPPNKSIKELESELVAIAGSMGRALIEGMKNGKEGANIVDITPGVDDETTFPAATLLPPSSDPCHGRAQVKPELPGHNSNLKPGQEDKAAHEQHLISTTGEGGG